MKLFDKNKPAMIEAELQPKTKRQKFMDDWGKYFIKLTVFAVLFVVIFGVLFRPGICHGQSMEPTLRDGDIIFLRGLGREVGYGDIVIVSAKRLDHPLIKRVIGMPGDTIEIDADAGVVYRNGVMLDEPYIAELTKTAGDMDGPVVVEEGHYFVMGDNRNNSLDSRYNKVGQVTEGEVKYKLLADLFNPFELLTR